MRSSLRISCEIAFLYVFMYLCSSFRRFRARSSPVERIFQPELAPLGRKSLHKADGHCTAYGNLKLFKLCNYLICIIMFIFYTRCKLYVFKQVFERIFEHVCVATLWRRCLEHTLGYEKLMNRSRRLTTSVVLLGPVQRCGNGGVR